jgi:predicted TIM-barrel enzyme
LSVRLGHQKPVIAMVHLGALPGTPLYDAEAGLRGWLPLPRKDLRALQAAGFDAVMFGNENDRPYAFEVDPASTATMAAIIGQLKPRSPCPSASMSFGIRWQRSRLAAATGARSARNLHRHLCQRHGRLGAGCRQGDALPRPLGRDDLADALQCIGGVRRQPRPAAAADRARSAVFSSIPDAVLVSGQITGEAAPCPIWKRSRKALPDTPVLANTGVKHDTVADVLADC